jgi:hypothetical protein
MHPSFVDSWPQLGGDLFFIFGTTIIWLGGTSFPSSWLHKRFKKLSVYIFSYDYYGCSFTLCMRMVLCVVVEYLLATLMLI